MRELGIQAASDTVGDNERKFINAEIQQLKSEMQRISDSTKWGKNKLLDGSTPVFDFQVGLHNDDFADRISFDSSDNVATIDALGMSGLDFETKEGASGALEILDNAQVEVNRIRSNLGALQNRLVSTINNLGIQQESLSAANSRIRDADIADVTADLTKNQILMQANTATLAQANQKNTLALKLLG
jgi:flagellin